MNRNFNIFIALLMLFLLNSCIVVKNDTKVESAYRADLSPKPEIQMSDEIVRSKDGDMIAFLPEGWFFVDVEDKASADVFAVAVNQDYTLSAVFSTIRKNKEYEEIVEKESVIGLARVFYNKHHAKTAGSLIMTGSPSIVSLGPLNFGKYTYSSGGSKCRAAVYVSSLGNYYEFALVPMGFRAKPIGDQAEIEKIFNSILATIQY